MSFAQHDDQTCPHSGRLCSSLIRGRLCQAPGENQKANAADRIRNSMENAGEFQDGHVNYITECISELIDAEARAAKSE